MFFFGADFDFFFAIVESQGVRSDKSNCNSLRLGVPVSLPILQHCCSKTTFLGVCGGVEIPEAPEARDER